MPFVALAEDFALRTLREWSDTEDVGEWEERVEYDRLDVGGDCCGNGMDIGSILEETRLLWVVNFSVVSSSTDVGGR